VEKSGRRKGRNPCVGPVKHMQTTTGGPRKRGFGVHSAARTHSKGRKEVPRTGKIEGRERGYQFRETTNSRVVGGRNAKRKGIPRSCDRVRSSGWGANKIGSSRGRWGEKREAGTKTDSR